MLFSISQHPAITSGFACLADRIDVAKTDTYTVAITAYAFSLYNTESQTRADLMLELEKRKVEGIQQPTLTHNVARA